MPEWFDTINLVWSIEYTYFILKIVFVLANSVYPYEMPHYAAFHLGLHCLPVWFCLFDLVLYGYGYVGTVSLPNHFFPWQA